MSEHWDCVLPIPHDGPCQRPAASAGADPKPHGTANDRLRAESWTDPDRGFRVVPLQDVERELRLLYGIIEQLARAQGGPSVIDCPSEWHGTPCVLGPDCEYLYPRQGGPSVIDVEALAEASMLAEGSRRIDGRIPALHRERAERIAAEYARLTAPGPRHDAARLARAMNAAGLGVPVFDADPIEVEDAERVIAEYERDES